MHRSVVPAAVVAALFASAASARPIDRLAAIGDSLSDEYFDGTSAFALAWSELIVEGRGVDFGPLAVTTWGEPRRTGYEDNWARFGATVTDAITAGQHTGVLEAIAERNVGHVTLFLGANDFTPLTFDSFWNPVYAGTWSQGQIDAYVGARVAGIESILDGLEPTGVHVVLASPPDATPLPLVELFFPDDAGRERVAVAVQQFSDALHAVAAARGLVFVDGWAFTRLLFGSPAAERPTILLGDVPIQLDLADADGGDPTHAWVADSAHPNTVIHGLMANLMILGLNFYGAGLDVFTEEELDTQAGIPYGGSDTFEEALGAAFGDFVFDHWRIFVDGFEDGLEAWDHVP